MGFTILVVILVIFLITREFWCWYWKVNEINSTLNLILKELKKSNGEIVEVEEPKKFRPDEPIIRDSDVKY